jgi:hypothetical protein
LVEERGVVDTYGYDLKNQLTSLAVNRGATTLANYGHTYGFAGQQSEAESKPEEEEE